LTVRCLHQLRRLWVALCLLGLMLSAGAQDGARPKVSVAWTAQVTYIVDGDSVWVRAEPGGQRRKLRLSGMDAPEVCQAYGRKSRAALQALVQGQQVRITVHAYDRYARGIATIERVADKQDIASLMVSQGWGWSEDYRGRRGRYWREQAQAQQEKAGMFARGRPETPAAFRKRHGPCKSNKS